MHITLSPLLDLLLSMICIALALRLLQRGLDLISIGYLMTGVAAFTGFFDMSDAPGWRWIHDFLSAESRLIGTFAVGAGIIALLTGQRGQRMAGYLLSTMGTGIMYYFYEIDKGPLPGLYIWAGAILLIAMLVLAYRMWRVGLGVYAVLSLCGLLLIVAVSAVGHLVPAACVLQPVDFFHISLMLAYTAISYAVSRYADATGF